MSLLLDALNRASKDKAAAAAVAVAKTTSHQPDDRAFSLHGPELDLLDSTVRPDATPQEDWQALELSLALTPTDSAPTLRPVDQSRTSTSTEAVNAGLKAVADPHPSAAPVPAPALPQKLVQPSPSGSRSAPIDAPRVAQSILRAKAMVPRAGKYKRSIALAAGAALISAGLGSVMLGWWGDPTIWLQTGSMTRASDRPAARATEIQPEAPVAMPLQVAATAPDRVQAPVPTPKTFLSGDRQPVNQRAKATMGRRAATTVDECVSGQASSGCQATSQVKPAAATGAAEKSVFLSRRTGPSALEQGYASLTQGRLQEAAKAYAQALTGNPEERDALLGLAYIADQQGREEDARTYYKRVLRQEPGNPVARAGLLTLSAADDVQTLGSRSREVAEENPDSAAAQSIFGHSLVRQGRLADAEQAFYRAQQLEPGVALHAFNLAVALDRLRKYGPARLYYKRALALSNQSGGERSGVPDSAVQARLEQLQAAIATNPASSR